MSPAPSALEDPIIHYSKQISKRAQDSTYNAYIQKR